MSGTEQIWQHLLAVLWGMLLGGVYFGGLWLNVKQIPMSPIAVWLVPLSFLIRITIVIFGIAWIGDGRPLAMIAAVAGLMITRQLVIAVVTKNLRHIEAGTKEVLP